MIGIISGCKEQQHYIDWLNHYGIKYSVIEYTSQLDDVDIALFCGGADIGKNKSRDLFETSAYKTCKMNGIPVVGICRGMQLICMLEGAQIVDLPETLNESHVVDEHKNSKWHNITLTNGESFRVNSRHHQRVFFLPIMFHTIGFDGDVPEYAEADDMMLVQCHPEKTEMWGNELSEKVIDFIKSKSNEM